MCEVGICLGNSTGGSVHILRIQITLRFVSHVLLVRFLHLPSQLKHRRRPYLLLVFVVFYLSVHKPCHDCAALQQLVNR